MLSFYFTMFHVDWLLSEKKCANDRVCLERVLDQGSRVWFHTPAVLRTNSVPGISLTPKMEMWVSNVRLQPGEATLG